MRQFKILKKPEIDLPSCTVQYRYKYSRSLVDICNYKEIHSEWWPWASLNGRGDEVTFSLCFSLSLPFFFPLPLLFWDFLSPSEIHFPILSFHFSGQSFSFLSWDSLFFLFWGSLVYLEYIFYPEFIFIFTNLWFPSSYWAYNTLLSFLSIRSFLILSWVSLQVSMAIPGTLAHENP